MERVYELIDTTDNDSHDEGDRATMLAYAAERNADDARYNLTADPAEQVKPNRWRVKPEGYAAANFKG